MSIRLFVFDLDGTALGGHEPYARFPAPLVRFLDGLERKGVRWATNTTWGIDLQHQLIRESGVKSVPLFLGGASGRTAGRIMDGNLIVDALYARHIRVLDRDFDHRYRRLVQHLAARLLRAGWVDQLAFNPAGHRYLGLRFAHREGARMGRRLLAELVDRGAMYPTVETGLLETLMPAHIHKGEILGYYQHRYGISADETLVAGDGLNDRQMFSTEVAAWSVCPSNAHPKLKALAGYTSLLPFSQGVIDGALRYIR